MKNTNISFRLLVKPQLARLVAFATLCFCAFFSPLGVRGQNSYTLTTASCQSQCGVYNIIDEVWVGFMCHNLGADTSLDPNTYVVGNADGSGGTLGWLFQWGRRADGHQERTSATTTTLSTTDVPGHSLFIVNQTTSPYNWRSTPNLLLWGTTKTANDPCPAGYKVPGTIGSNILKIGAYTWTGNGLRYNTGTDNLYLPAAGFRWRRDGSLLSVGANGSYWLSTSTNYPGALGGYLYFGHNSSNNTVIMGTEFTNLAEGYSVRCISEL